MTDQRKATIETGVAAVMLHDAGFPQRERFAVECLTAKGAKIFAWAAAEAGERHVREIVTAAVDAKY